MMSTQSIHHSFQKKTAYVSVTQIEFLLYMNNQDKDEIDHDNTFRLVLQFLPEKQSLSLRLTNPADVTMYEIFYSLLSQGYRFSHELREELKKDIFSLLDQLGPFAFTLKYNEQLQFYRRLDEIGSLMRNNASAEFTFTNERDECEMEADEVLYERDTLAYLLNEDKTLMWKLMIESFLHYVSTEHAKEFIKHKECPIFLEPLEIENTYISVCGHSFSKKAFEQLVKESETRCINCPMCRKHCHVDSFTFV